MAVVVRRCPHPIGRLGSPRRSLRFQSPLIKPGMRFSRTRLSDVLHRPALDAATRLRGSIQCPLLVLRFVCRVSVAVRQSPARPPCEHMDEVRPLPSSTVILPWYPQYYGPLRLPLPTAPPHGGWLLPVHVLGRLSQSSHCRGGDGPLLFPCWLSHHSTSLTPRGSSGLHSKRFTPSLAFALSTQARLPVVLLAEGDFRRGRLHVMLRTGGSLTLLPRAFPRASSPGSPQSMAAVLQRWLGPSLDRTFTGKST